MEVEVTDPKRFLNSTAGDPCYAVYASVSGRVWVNGVPAQWLCLNNGQLLQSPAAGRRVRITKVVVEYID